MTKPMTEFLVKYEGTKNKTRSAVKLIAAVYSLRRRPCWGAMRRRRQKTISTCSYHGEEFCFPISGDMGIGL